MCVLIFVATGAWVTWEVVEMVDGSDLRSNGWSATEAGNFAGGCGEGMAHHDVPGRIVSRYCNDKLAEVTSHFYSVFEAVQVLDGYPEPPPRDASYHDRVGWRLEAATDLGRWWGWWGKPISPADVKSKTVPVEAS